MNIDTNKMAEAVQGALEEFGTRKYRACATLIHGLLAVIKQQAEVLKLYAADDDEIHNMLRGFKARAGDKCPNSPANKALAASAPLVKLVGEV